MAKKIKNVDVNEVIEATREANKKVDKAAKSFWKDFKKFVAKGNIVDLAVAVVVGTAFNKIVTALVTNIITPLTSCVVPAGDLSSLKIVLKPAVEADEAAGIEAVAETAITYGIFLEAVIDFLIIALSIYFVMKVLIKVKESFGKRERLAAEKKAKEEEAKRKAELDAENARLEQIKKDFIEDVAVQANVLEEIRDIMLRIEAKSEKSDRT